jgi:hypothetical protein
VNSSDYADNAIVFHDHSPSNWNHPLKGYNGAKHSTTTQKYYPTSIRLDGTDDYLRVEDSLTKGILHKNFDLVSANVPTWNMSVWIKVLNLSLNQYIICHFEDANNFWALIFRGNANNELRFVANDLGVQVVLCDTGANAINDNNWHHIVVSKNPSNEYGIYVDGIQLAYLQDNSVKTCYGYVYIGQQGSGLSHSDVYIDELAIIHSNLYGCNPTVGLGDSIVIPTTYLKDDGSYQ